MAQKDSATNYGQQADTINNHGNVNICLIAPVDPKTKLLQEVPEQYHRDVNSVLRKSDKTPTHFLRPVKTGVIAFREGRIDRRFAEVDRLAAAFFGAPLLLFSLIFLGMLLLHKMTLLQSAEMLGWLALSSTTFVLNYMCFVRPQRAATAFMKTYSQLKRRSNRR